MAKIPHSLDAASFWHAFAVSQGLSPMQRDLFEQYERLLSFWSKRINLTAITGILDIVEYHFKDSLALKKIIDPLTVHSLIDVGSGAGFPGIPLAIAYPHLNVTLIEVTAKKIKFLDTVITDLGLGDRVAIYDQDWRSFLRVSNAQQDQPTLFCARASLQLDELCRIFKAESSYRGCSLVYWAAAGWQPEATIAPFVVQQETYRVGDRERKLVLLKKAGVI